MAYPKITNHQNHFLMIEQRKGRGKRLLLPLIHAQLKLQLCAGAFLKCFFFTKKRGRYHNALLSNHEQKLLKHSPYDFFVSLLT